ncbi:MAG TPA: hypothetical protein VNK41_06060 [Vicinamibacterales bacterium]|nr:hypothetical protein [Vicinamibacterales bacterium]
MAPSPLRPRSVPDRRERCQLRVERDQLVRAILALVLVQTAHAQPRSGGDGGATVVWTIGGTGAGFGLGLWLGLTAFDDAIARGGRRRSWERRPAASSGI